MSIPSEWKLELEMEMEMKLDCPCQPSAFFTKGNVDSICTQLDFAPGSFLRSVAINSISRFGLQLQECRWGFRGIEKIGDKRRRNY